MRVSSDGNLSGERSRPGPPPGSRRSRRPPGSALDAALERVGDRWSLLVVDALLDGPRRFGDLSQTLPGIASNVLTQRLRALEAVRLVIARPYSQRPPRSAYALTPDGRDLAGALRLLEQWGADTHPDHPTPAHGDCGTPLEARWWCPTCDRGVERPDEGPVIWT